MRVFKAMKRFLLHGFFLWWSSIIVNPRVMRVNSVVVKEKWVGNGYEENIDLRIWRIFLFKLMHSPCDVTNLLHVCHLFIKCLLCVQNRLNYLIDVYHITTFYNYHAKKNFVTQKIARMHECTTNASSHKACEVRVCTMKTQIFVTQTLLLNENDIYHTKF